MSTYVPIQAITLSSATATVEFTGIPQTYTDLILVVNGFGTAATFYEAQINGDTGSNYTRIQMNGNGSTATSGVNNGISVIYGEYGSSSTDIGISTMQFNSYANATINKTIIERGNAIANYIYASATLWNNTNAINRITVKAANSGNHGSGTTFTLYGIGSGAPKAFGGDEVRTDGTYWYHIFRSSGRFEPVQDLSVDYLVVAGGGGGGASQSGVSNGGGGGAGGYRTSTGFSVSANVALTVTIGAGGTAGSGGAGGKGNNSVFGTITSTGGGRGAYTGQVGGTGGSGGGGSSASGNDTAGGAGNEGSYSPVEGYAGGSASTSGGNYGGGGGGGASEAGNTDGQSTGGDGSATSISGSSVTYAGGGSGGTNNSTPFAAGTGGGGTGGSGSGATGTAGTANTGGGGGGGGAGGGAAGGAGGSGIVIVRYSV